MGLFSFSNRKNVEKRSLSIGAESAFLNGDNLEDTATPNTSLNLSYVYSAMYIVSSSMAQLPISILRRNGGTVESGSEHPASKVISFRPNEWQSSYKWRETEQFRCLGWGNSYSEIIRKRGVVVGIKTHKPWLVKLMKHNGTGTYYWSVSDEFDLDVRVVELDDMIHIKDTGYDEKLGVSRIKQNSDAIGWGLSMQSYGKSFFGSNGKPTGAISPKMELNGDSWDKFKSMYKKSVSMMSSNQNRTMLLPSEVSYQSFTIPPEDMQFLDSRKFSRAEIAGIFNVPPHMIGDLENATFSNISEQALQFVKYTLMPWIVSWEQELNYKLFTDSERSKGYYVKFNLAGLLRGTPKDRADFYKAMIEVGVYNRNEARVLEDMNPIEGLDEMVISQNVKSVRFMEAEADNAINEKNGE